MMNNSFELVGGSGKNYGYANNPNRLKDRFMASGEDSATVVMMHLKDPPKLEVDRNTPNSVWNDFTNKYAYDDINY